MFPAGYKIVIRARLATLAQLEAVARTFADEVISAHPEAAARSWKAANLPVITREQPDGHFSGWVLTPTGDIELRRNGELIEILHSNQRREPTHAYGLDGVALEERR